MKTSDALRKTMARNPSHFGSKRNAPPAGSASVSLASIGSMGGSRGAGGTAGRRVVMPPPSSLGAAVGHHLAGEQRHRLADRRVVHDAALVEVADELVHRVGAGEGAHAVDAVVGVAEDPHLAVDVVEVHALHPGEDLLPGLEALDVALAERAQAQTRLAEEAQQARLALLPGPRP